MEQIAIMLPVQAWNVILNALRQRPYGEVFQLIDELNKQASVQLTPPPPEESGD